MKDVMTTDPVILESSATLDQAAQRMRDEDIGDVLVKEGGTLRGIVTDRDIALRAVADGKAPDATTLGDVCTSELVTVSPDDDLREVVEMMRERTIRRVPVVEDDTAVGILSIGDLAVMRDPDSLLADISAAPSDQT